MPARSVTFAAAALVAAPALAQPNLVANGDFEAGNSGFLSDYSFSPTSNCCEGQYTVRGNGSTFNGGFVDPPASSPGSTLMMVINGSTTPGLRIWYQNVAVLSAGLHRITVRGCTAVAGGPAVLQWQINGNTLGAAFSLPAETGQWISVETLWLAPAAGPVELAVRNLNTSSFPNDFYIDDISLTADVCAADIGITGGVPGHDGILDNNDFVVFVDYFFTHNPVADVGVTGGIPGHDGAFDNNDFVVFIDQFFAGC